MAIKLSSKYQSDCKTCGGVVNIGDIVFWTPGEKGVKHEQCPDLSKDPNKIAVETVLKLAGSQERKDFPGLFEHQREVVNTVEKTPDAKLYLAWEPGLGKTLGSLASAQVGDNFPLIIVCPSVVKINWQREAKRWIDREAQILSGRKPKPIDADIVIINYDIIRYWEDELIALGAKGIVFDESHYVKNPQAERTQSAIRIAKSVDGMRFMLSGTPTPNSVYDLVAPLEMLDVLKLFGGERRYIRRYCPPVQTHWGVSYGKSYNRKELHQNLVNSCFVRKRKKDCLDLPEKTRVEIPVPVKLQDDMEFYAPLVAQMQRATLSEAKRVVREQDKVVVQTHMATERYRAGMAKVQHIVDLAADIDEPLVIMVHHNEVVDELMNKLKKRKPKKLVGGMTPKKRQESIDDFQEGKTDLLICSITAAGVGINLQRGSQMIIGEIPMTYAELDQAESRCHRSGAQNDLTVHLLLGVGTFDEITMNILAKKEMVSAAVDDGAEIEYTGSDDIVARKLLEIYTRLDSRPTA